MNHSDRAKNNPWIVALILIGILLVGIFGFRAARAIHHFQHNPPKIEQSGPFTPSGWMPVGYLSKICRIPTPELMKQLGLPDNEDPHLSLEELNTRNFPDQPGVLLEKAKTLTADCHPLLPPPSLGQQP